MINSILLAAFNRPLLKLNSSSPSDRLLKVGPELHWKLPSASFPPFVPQSDSEPTCTYEDRWGDRGVPSSACEEGICTRYNEVMQSTGRLASFGTVLSTVRGPNVYPYDTVFLVLACSLGIAPNMASPQRRQNKEGAGRIFCSLTQLNQERIFSLKERVETCQECQS